jgi:molybdopterin-containing oxidoreductase family membrane subunit
VLSPASTGYWMLLLLALGGTALFALAITITVLYGLGEWGNNIPVAWAFAITNFVWWIGIGHAGTLISAILYLFQQKWRTSINRFTEAMTLFAVMCAGLFPLLHLGRPWFFYWLFPYPSPRGIWPQFRSPLTWDVAAVSTYFTISALFFYLGLIPDMAALRDTARGRLRRLVYGFFALGWRGSGHHWQTYRSAYLLLAGLATPLVISVHSVVSFDFAVSILPGWHSTVFPPYFVAGAIFSGFAMVITLMVPVRRLLRLENVITLKHLDNMGKVTLAMGWFVAYGYLMEGFMGWYGHNSVEMANQVDRYSGVYGPMMWVVVLCNVVVPQVLWSRRVRTSPLVMWAVSILINIGMWSERFVIVVQSLHRDFLPSSGNDYLPTWVDLALLAGSLAFFGLLFLLFLRLVPGVPVSEVKELASELDEAKA